VGNAAGSAYQRTGAASRGAYRNNSGVSNSRSSSYSRSSSLPVIVRLTLTVVVELLLPVVVFLVAVGLPVVPEAVFPVQVAVADRVPDK